MDKNIKEHDSVVLLNDLPGTPFVASDSGVVVYIYDNASAFEVEFANPAGKPRFLVVTVETGDVWKINREQELPELRRDFNEGVRTETPEPAAYFQDVCGFYRLALEYHFVDDHAPIRWADAEIAKAPKPDIRIIDLSLADPKHFLYSNSPLCELSPFITGNSFRMFGALLYRRIADTSLIPKDAARVLYKLTKFDGAVDALGDQLYWIDEVFEPWSGGPVPAEHHVIDFLSHFTDVLLPPV